MSRATLACLALLLSVAPPAAAGPAQTSSLALPAFAVDTANPAGLTTLFAVRNGSADPVSVRVRYYAPVSAWDDPLDAFTEVVALAGHATLTRNLRDVGLPAGVDAGYVLVDVVDPSSGEPRSDLPVLGGDYFLVDPSGDFARGGALLDLDPASPGYDLCQRWSARFLEGGGFDAGTGMHVFLSSNPTDGATAPILTGTVYDESGTATGQVEVTSADLAFTVESGDLGLPTAFGTVEWRLADGALGAIEASYTAESRYSVELPSTCGSGGTEFDPDTFGDLASTLTAILDGLVGSLGGSGIPWADLDYDPDTKIWSGTLVLDTGQTVELVLQLLDAAGEPQAIYVPGSTETVHLWGTASGPEGSLDFDLVADDLADGDDLCTVNGSGVLSGGGLTGTVLVDDVVADKAEADDYPESGRVVLVVDGVRVVVTFDGTRYATVTVTAAGFTTTFILDLETGELT